MPGFDEDVIIKIDKDSGYLLDTSVGKIITKEESIS